MDVVNIEDSVEDITRFAITAAHSRFPVIGESKDDVIGILLAKDLLRVFAGESFNLREMLRPAVFVPESKRLNVLLRDFRVSRNHMAIVVDEYGGVAGLVTIEDVLEQIVGDIEDEYDFDEAADNIILDQAGRYRVKAGTEIEDFNEAFATDFSDSEYDTVGGLLIRRLGRLPKRNEIVELAGLRFQVLRADSRRVYSCSSSASPRPSRSAADGLAQQGVAFLAGARRCWPTHLRAVPRRRPGAGRAVLAARAGRAGGAVLGQPRRRARAGFGIGFAWGLGAMLAGVSWLYVALNRFGGMPMPLAALAILLFCAFMGLSRVSRGALRRAAPGQGGA
jgi:Mg2+/Co2+ transporter CorC